MGAALALFYEKSERKKVDHDFDVYCGPNIISDEAINFKKEDVLINIIQQMNLLNSYLTN